MPTSRHYIVVVHGIGEQRVNSTATPVVHRFAEVRQKKQVGHFEPLTASYLSAQAVRRGGRLHGWSEFDGIPLIAGTSTGEFRGTPATNQAGENFRFVDINWQHILRRHQERYASQVDIWTRALLDRSISFDKECRKNNGQSWYPEWALPLLKSIANTALPAKRLLAFKYANVTKLVFDDFLGDVHLYGDYARTRGKAVRHFHVVLDEITIGDFIQWCYRNPGKDPRTEYHLPEFTIIAHSLGSIMSFDALVYANAKEDVRKEQAVSWRGCTSLPFLGYTYESENEIKSWKFLMKELKNTIKGKGLQNFLQNLNVANLNEEFKSITSILQDKFLFDDSEGPKSCPEIPHLLWRGRVRNFITIGSPIDKYHVMWHANYRHMGLNRAGFVPPQGWKNGVNDWLVAPDRKIRHHNFCDEQDPVGHHLDVAEQTDHYGKIFEKVHDVVFRRYAKPGVAHNMYWEDKELFEGIIKEILDSPNGGKSGFFFRDSFREGPKAFRQALLWAYFRVPFLSAVLTGALISYSTLGKDTLYRVVAGLGAVLFWTAPNLLQAYTDEANPENFDNQTIWTKIKRSWIVGKLRLRRGVLSRLVSGMIEWRRIARNLNKSAPPEQQLKSIGGGWSFWWRFVWRTVVALAITGFFRIEIATEALGWENLWWTGLFISLSYLGVMLYVAGCYLYMKYIK